MHFVCEWTASAILLSGLHAWSMTGEYLHRGRIMPLLGMWPLLLLSSPVAAKGDTRGSTVPLLSSVLVDIQRHLTFALLNYYAMHIGHVAMLRMTMHNISVHKMIYALHPHSNDAIVQQSTNCAIQGTERYALNGRSHKIIKTFGGAPTI